MNAVTNCPVYVFKGHNTERPVLQGRSSPEVNLDFRAATSTQAQTQHTEQLKALGNVLVIASFYQSVLCF